jgi:hypothetical protein
MTVGLYAVARAYNPGLLIFCGILLLALGGLMLVFPRFFARFRRRGWPGSRETTDIDVRRTRLLAIGPLIVGAICLVIALVRAITG